MTTDYEIQDGGETATTVSDVGSKLNAEQGSTMSTEHTSVGTSACTSASTSTSLVSTQLFVPSTTECDLQSQMNDDDDIKDGDDDSDDDDVEDDDIGDNQDVDNDDDDVTVVWNIAQKRPCAAAKCHSFP